MDREHLMVLIEAHLDCTLTHSEGVELNALLGGVADARKVFWECVHQRVGLKSLLQEQVGADSAAQLPTLRGVTEPALSPRRPHRVSMYVGLVTAVIVVVGVAGWLALGPAGPKPGDAADQNSVVLSALKIESVVGDVWLSTPGGRGAAAVGDTVEHGTILHTEEGESRAVLHFPDGTRITFDPHSISRLIMPDSNTMEIELTAGSLSAVVAKRPPGRPLRLRTPNAVVDVLGTSLYTSCTPDSTYLGLVHGEVRITRTLDGQALDLKPGEYVVVPTAPGPLAPVSPPRRVEAADWQHGNTASSRGLIAAHPTEPWLAVAPPKRPISLLDVRTGEKLRDLGKFAGRADSMAFSPNGKELLVGLGDGNVLRFGGKDFDPLPAFSGASVAVKQIQFSRSGDRVLLVCGADVAAPVKARLLEADGRLVTTWDLTGRRVRSAALEPGGRSIVIGTDDGRLMTSPDDNIAWTVCRVSDRGVRVVSFRSDGKILAVGDDRGLVRLLEWPNGTEFVALSGHLLPVRSVAFTSDGRFVFTGSQDDTARMWDARSGRQLGEFRPLRSVVLNLALSERSGVLVAGDREGWFAAWVIADLLAAKGGMK